MATNRSLARVNAEIDLWVERADKIIVAEYRQVIWNIFCRILHETPQYTGRAVANWNIGVGVPCYDVDNSLGDDADEVQDGHYQYGENAGLPYFQSVPRHQKGDDKWMRKARDRNRHKVQSTAIHKQTRVYFNNFTLGDTDGGKSASMYLGSLQDPSYWTQKLRLANSPYETAQESIIYVLSKRQMGYRGKAGAVPGGASNRLMEEVWYEDISLLRFKE